MTWSLRGPQPLVGKLFSLFVDCEKMCAEQFELGFAKLKTLVEESVRAGGEAAQ